MAAVSEFPLRDPTRFPMRIVSFLSREIQRKRVRAVEAAAEDIRHQRTLG